MKAIIATIAIVMLATGCASKPITNQTDMDIAMCHRDYGRTMIGVTPLFSMGNPHLEKAEKDRRVAFVEKCLSDKGYQVAAK